MLLGIIDLGTNSVRFDVYRLYKTAPKSISTKKKPSQSKAAQLVHRDKLMIRMGQEVFSNGVLGEAASARCMDAFASFSRSVRALRVDKVVAFATSALREAKDGAALVRQIKAKTGIDVRIISGQEEAHFISKGILANDIIGKEPTCLIDIGGGSTEISICKDKKIIHSYSFPLGTARIQQLYLKRIPPTNANLLELENYVWQTLASKVSIERWPKCNLALASSGTAKAIYRLAEANSDLNKKKLVSTKAIENIVNDLKTKNTSELLTTKGMDARRIDMILGGTILLGACLDVIGAKHYRISDHSLRHGILAEEVDLYKKRESSHLGHHIDELINFASKFGQKKEHINHVSNLGRAFFKALVPIHRMPDSFQNYLVAALSFKDAGSMISQIEHSKHSVYILKNAHFFSIVASELEVICALILQHEKKKPFKDFDLQDIKNKNFPVSRVNYLLALMVLADCLDIRHSGPSTKMSSQNLNGLPRIRLVKTEIILSNYTFSGVEKIRLDQQRSLIESVFNRKIKVID